MALAFAVSFARVECDGNLFVVKWRDADLRTLNKLVEGINRAATDARKQNYAGFQQGNRGNQTE